MEKPSDLQVVRDHEPPRKGWVEPIVALLMALTTVGTAWCSYQSAAWTRQSNRLLNEFNALERRAGLLTIQGMQQATIHTAMFMELLAAQQAGNEKLVNFYAQRFPPDVHKAYDAWLAQKPFENPNADPHPFVPRLYEAQATFPVSTSRTLFCLPQSSSLPVRRESLSSSACVQWLSSLPSRSSYLRSYGRPCFLYEIRHSLLRAFAYARQNQRDHKALFKAIRDGRIQTLEE